MNVQTDLPIQDSFNVIANVPKKQDSNVTSDVSEQCADFMSKHTNFNFEKICSPLKGYNWFIYKNVGYHTRKHLGCAFKID